MNSNYNNISELAEKIIVEDSNKTLLIFASNSVGKTTLSKCICDLKEFDEYFCFNTFIEETFSWKNDFDNDEYFLTINENDEFIRDAIITYGLENRINEIFRSLIDSKIDANFIIEENKIKKICFSLVTGDNLSVSNIKLSKGEESLFIWSIFCTIIEMSLNEKIEENAYEKLNYIIIDDPVTSLEEEKIVSIALYIKDLIFSKIADLRNKNINIGILITTHSRLLYNVLFEEIKKQNNCFRLFKNSNGYDLVKQNDSPFGYHIEELKLLKKVIDSQEKIEKIYFNIFRNILEKTASFLGYSSKWSKCLSDSISDKNKFIRLLNLYSHSRLFDLDDKLISDEEQELFKKFFIQFLKDYKWNEGEIR